MVSPRGVRDLLEDRPDLRPAIEDVLEPEPPWTFEDVPVDSGAFGELVSRGIVERAGDGYRVADRDAVRRGVAGDVDDGGARLGDRFSTPSLPVSGLEVALLVGAVALVVAFRMIPIYSVYRGGHVVLSSNDPYYYRYWVEQILIAPGVTPSTVPRQIANGEPLMVTTLWLAAELLGGTRGDAGHVLALYPVASAAVTAVFVYLLAVVVTDDRRIGLASVALLAVLPGHAFRTSLGFADHHPFDFLWLSLTVLALAVLARGARRRRDPTSIRTLAATGGLALGVAGQTLAWDKSPILLAAIGFYVAFEAIRAVANDESPFRSGSPVVVGVLLGGAVTWVGHVSLDWHTTLVVSAPFLVVVGGAGALAAGEVAHRFEVPIAAFLGVEVVGFLAWIWALSTFLPTYWSRLMTGVTSHLLARENVAEAQSLFSDSQGWLLLFGFILVVSLPYMAWGTYRARRDGTWLVVAVYGWYLLVLSIVRVRFVGELAPVVVVFAGLGLVHLADWIDVARPPAPFADGPAPELSLPEPRAVGQLAMLFLLVASLSIVQVPVKTSQVTVATAQSDAAFWMDEYSEERGLTYPSNYVFSEWGWNRMYNYFVSGESRSYGFARTNYRRFLDSTEPERWYERLGERRAFVVTTPDAIGGPDQIGTRLHRDNGAGSATTPALVRYRLVHVEGDYKVFAVAPGAVIRGKAEPGATVAAATDVEVSGTSFTYSRRTTAGPDGGFSVRVAHPGEYRIANASVTVPESAVLNGTPVTVDRLGG